MRVSLCMFEGYWIWIEIFRIIPWDYEGVLDWREHINVCICGNGWGAWVILSMWAMIWNMSDILYGLHHGCVT